MNDFSPFRYQQKLIDEVCVSNKKAKETIDKALSEGHTITLWAQLPGPYINHNTYWISDGTMVQMKEAASLHWVPPDLIGNWY